ncbi:PaaI family thioesterase, partial [Ralstonia solanacearum]|uniref:PaaI family thioesterase n=1 Tax=Ralstonia solanacearum TaxID=305 RepID=UPI001E562E56
PPPPMHPSQLSGLQLLQAMACGELPRATISDLIPMTMESIDTGAVRFATRADKRHLNPLGGVHGGFAATVLDSVTGCAVHSMLEAGVGYSTVDLNVKMVKAVPVDTPLVAEGRVLHVSRTIGVSEGALKTQDGTLLAHATATCVIRRP